VTLLQSPRRPSSGALAFGPHGLPDPDRVFPGSGGFGELGDRSNAPRVDLGRTLDLATERPQAASPAGRGPGVMVAAIVASSLTLAGIILLVRGNVREPLPAEPAASVTEVRAPVEIQAEPEPAELVPIDQPNRVASQRASAAAKAEPVPEITPAAIAPATPSRASASATAARPEVVPAEVAPPSGLPAGLYLPPPVFDDPPATPEPAPEPGSSPGDGASEPLPGIEERAPAEPRDEPGAAAPDPAAPGAAAQPTHADLPAPFDVDELEALDRHPARADRSAS
jgi:hypothetical protein